VEELWADPEAPVDTSGPARVKSWTDRSVRYLNSRDRPNGEGAGKTQDFLVDEDFGIEPPVAKIKNRY
jgi:hypothetical protein